MSRTSIRGAVTLRRTLAAAMACLAILGSAPGAAAQAESFTQVVTIPLDGTVIDGCTEPVELRGSLSDRLHLTFDAHGGFTGVSTTNAAGLSGIGVVTGMVYRAVGVTVNPGHFSVVPDTTDIDHLTLTLVDRTRLVGPAGALTLDIRTTFHITKIDGQNAVIFEHTSVSCA